MPGPEREHGVRALEQHGDPARPVVDPLCVDDLVAPDAQEAGEVIEERGVHRS